MCKAKAYPLFTARLTLAFFLLSERQHSMRFHFIICIETKTHSIHLNRIYWSWIDIVRWSYYSYSNTSQMDDHKTTAATAAMRICVRTRSFVTAQKCRRVFDR